MNEVKKQTLPPSGPKGYKKLASVEGVSKTTSSNVLPQAYFIDSARPINPDSFPDQRKDDSSGNPLTTIPNLQYMLSVYDISVRYNVIQKKLQIIIPGATGCPDNEGNSAMTQIISLAVLNKLSVGQIPNYVAAIGDRNHFNPVADWIKIKPWDGSNRYQEFYDTLEEREDFPNDLKELLLKRWLLSAVAAALMPSGFRARGVLTLQGPQSIGKTGWVNALVPEPSLQESVLKLDHHLDAGSKDSQINAFCHWIVEIGELDSSLKKDIGRLKGFITSNRDKIRRPYARAISEYQRRTVFCATVNDHSFLVDDTGNSRWWTIPVTSVNYNHGIDMQQLFAQLAVDFQKGEPWWLTQKEEQWLEEHNKDHRRVSVIRDRVLEALDLDLPEESRPAMTTTEVLQKVGINKPTNPQAKECAGALRECLGEPKKINGKMKWRVPLRVDQWSPSFRQDDDTD